ncbi:(3S,6E)-nerolidol synthase 2 [Heracleum sosnowskyi]|uniref:(3S,6E)-nerolidol synthase 2 n=1 Tax=Heracleum sosnowskyi TaxID=360622 RepID=A0AAD8HJF9_9APIA|nr:(3S,6E)-nerolidol synthase 2 [Heracleum sosnowskyi]
MLEKIGLPTKPSLRGNTWVVDASHCQGCSSQFTFIHRKHHCRRCGGIFCSSCTQHRMVLRGQGDSPVRICEPCKKLEEAARFEMRHGHKNRTGRGGPKLSSKDEDDVLNTILGSDEKDSLSSGKEFKILAGSQRSSSSASCSNIQEATTQDEGAILRSLSVGVTDMASTTPDELRQQALDEKKKYKTLKAEGKSEEALRAFKRGKELERQAGAMDLQLRKGRRKALSSISTNDISKTKEEPAESSKINKLSPQLSKDDDLSSELKKLGWSDLDLHDADKKPVKVSLEGELTSLLGEVSMKTDTEKVVNGLDKSEVIAIKKNALALKREGKLAEAREELKRAKILEKQIEEQEFLIDADDSDDELSALIRSMDSDKQNLSSRKVPDVNFNFENLLGIADNLGVDNFDVNDEDMDDPDITAALESVGWTADMDETNLESKDSLGTNLKTHGHMTVQNEPTFTSAEIKKPTHAAPKSKFMIQRELLALKKRALALRREGKADEADEELKKGKFLEQQLEEMDQSSKGKITQVNSVNKNAKSEILDVGDEVEDVTEQDMNDPSYASLLNNLGWKDEENEHSQTRQKGNTSTHEITSESSVAHVHSGKQLEPSSKSKGEVQRELLGLKRKALALRRQGEADEAEEVLEMAKVLEAQLSQMEAPKQEVPSEVNKLHNDEPYSSLNIEADNGAVGTPVKDIISNQSRQTKPTEGLESKDQMIEKPEGKSENQISDELNHSQVMASTNNQSSPQKEILAHKKAALALKREGKLVEAREELRQAKLLEKSLQDNIQKASTSFSSSDVSSSNNTVTGQKEKSPVAAPKMSGRNRFKLQQESLSHKRQALKLRREGRTEEADAEFEMAKALEIQLEELNSSESNKSSMNLAEPVDDVGIEDLLDPQLLSALRAIGIDDATNVSRVPEKPEVLNSSAGKIDNSVGERTLLEERIKAEKVKALTLKRSGKQPEALEALRRARMLEKKLASLAS